MKKSSTQKKDYSSLKKYLRVVNYISAAQLYLKDNFFLERPLTSNDIKDRLLGHWGGATGVNFIYAHVNFYLKNNQLQNQGLRDVMFMLGPGHAFPALQANLFMERTLSDYFSDDKNSKKRFAKNIFDFKVSYDKAGLSNLIKYFGTSQGFPTHASPVTPGAILEGGELGYSISNAFGSVLDNKDLITICVIGDGEFETASIATGFHGSKFINSKTNGVVLPIINLNGYKISGPTILGRMNDDDLINLFKGYGYEPLIVDARSDTKDIKSKDNYDINLDNVHKLMQETLEKSFSKILEMKKTGEVRGLPVILFKSDKGWTGPKHQKDLSTKKNIKIEGNFESHQVPFANAKTNELERLELEKWLNSYNIRDLFVDRELSSSTDSREIVESRFRKSGDLFLKEIEDIVPDKFYRMGNNIHIPQNGKDKLKSLVLPSTESIIDTFKDRDSYSPMKATSEYLRQVFKLNERTNNFRFFSPDETYSNKLDSIFKEESRGWTLESRPWDRDLSKGGRVIEMLSENTLIGMMMGYVLTGRHAFFASYEAFVQVVSSMIDQYIKFLRIAKSVNWRGDVAGFNIILTSSSWAQEHNGFSHQNPGFIDNILMKNTDIVDIYFPIDARATVFAVDEIMKSKNKVNVLVAAKDDNRPIFLNKKEAITSIKDNMVLVEKFSDEKGRKGFDYLIVGIGDHVSFEAIAGINLVNNLFKKNDLGEKRGRFKIAFLNIAKLSAWNYQDKEEDRFIKNIKELIDLENTRVFVNFHGHPEILARYFYDVGVKRENIESRGYIERGGIATLLEMHILNMTSRYHVAEFILIDLLKQRKISQREYEVLIGDVNIELVRETNYIKENFADSDKGKSYF